MSEANLSKADLPQWPVRCAAGILAVLVVAVFHPIVGFAFVDWDTLHQVVDNRRIHGLTWANLKHILTKPCVSSYYPVRTLTFAINYQLGGLNPAGYKLSNALLHYANVLLLLWLVLRLFRHPAGPQRTLGRPWDLAVATFAAGLYAVHPVVVEPVAWVMGREELLLTMGALGCFHFHLTARDSGGQHGALSPSTLACHAGAAVCCAVACLSNAVGAVVPLLIVAWDLLVLPRPKLWKIVGGTAPLWAVSLVTIVIKGQTGSDEPIMPPAYSIGRVMLIMNVYWLNLKTLAWPANLSLFYDWLYPESFLDRDVLLGGVAIAVTCAMLWLLRRRKTVLFGLLWFGLALGPAAQVMPHHIHRADRFLYLPLAGLTVAIAMSLRPLATAVRGRMTVAGLVGAGALMLVLFAVKSHGQVWTWRNSRSAWEQCLFVDPNNLRAHDAIGDELVKKGFVELAFQHFDMVLRERPYCVETLETYAQQLAGGPTRVRDYPRAIAMARYANDCSEWRYPETRRVLAEAHFLFARHLQDRGAFANARDNYVSAIDVDHQFPDASLELAWLLATCPDGAVRNPAEAVRQAESAFEHIRYPDPADLEVLATAYAQAGQKNLAAISLRRAVNLALAIGDTSHASKLREQLESLKNPGAAPTGPSSSPTVETRSSKPEPLSDGAD